MTLKSVTHNLIKYVKYLVLYTVITFDFYYNRDSWWYNRDIVGIHSVVQLGLDTCVLLYPVR